MNSNPKSCQIFQLPHYNYPRGFAQHVVTAVSMRAGHVACTLVLSYKQVLKCSWLLVLRHTELPRSCVNREAFRVSAYRVMSQREGSVTLPPTCALIACRLVKPMSLLELKIKHWENWTHIQISFPGIPFLFCFFLPIPHISPDQNRTQSLQKHSETCRQCLSSTP